jgi:hypothetical protein
MPFVYLGPSDIIDFHGERPITCRRIQNASEYLEEELVRLVGCMV